MCPYYLAIGMTYEQYWYGESYLTITYYKAHLQRIDIRSQEMWMQGLYFVSALECTIGNMFGKKGSKKIEYVKEPIRVTPKSEEELRREQLKEKQKAIQSLKRLQSTMKANNMETKNVGSN